jgi:alkanesulfonate monooxygenase SsuD/methylene tetrahydromethanopterin reductase-like flavin-dependent oxidoreductase (luciferase family)
MRFDMRAPEWGAATTGELYAAALEMAAWGEANGCAQIVVSEHHASPDGYLPSPLVLAAAIAGRTRSVGIQVAALVVPLHDPVRLAEDMAILDIVSGGRVGYVTAVGYRKEEYAMFGHSLSGRGARMEESLAVLRQAWTGEPFSYQGRPVHVTPKPLTPGGPMLFMGGNSAAAARRAARLGMGMMAQGADASIEQIYLDECEKLGKTAGPCMVPPPGTATSVFISKDPDRSWEELGRYLLHDAQAYAEWLGDLNMAVSKSVARSTGELRAQHGAYRILTPDEAITLAKQYGVLLLHPLCGGVPPDLAWQSLELLESKVLPALSPPEGVG